MKVNTNIVEKRIKDKIIEYLSPVNENNFEDYFNGFLELVISYKGLISKKNLINLLLEIRKNSNINEGQDELICDIDNRLSGYCNDVDYIVW